MQRDCPVCFANQSHSKLIDAFPPTFQGRLSYDRYSLVDCQDCDLVYLSPAPTPSDLRQMYVETSQFDDEQTEGPHAAAVGEYMDGCFAKAASITAAKDLSVLEVGSGPAWMCAAAKRHSPSVRTFAQDVSPEMAERCPWVDEYFVGELRDAPRGKFAISSMTHVIEHLIEPSNLLLEVADRLATGGVLFVSAPHRPSGWRAGDGPSAWLNYSYHHVPAHVQYFSEKALRKLAYQAGFALAGWDASHEGGAAFEAFLVKM